MSVDTAAIRQWLDDPNIVIVEVQIEANLREALDYIDALTARCETAERAAAMSKSDFLRAYAEDEKRWQMRGDDVAGAGREENEG